MGLHRLTLSLERRAYTRLRLLADRKQGRAAIRSGQAPMPAHLLTGERGEDAAFFHLRALGYTIVARRWRSQRIAGDLDLVAWDGPTLIVFEIKTRTVLSREQAFAPAEAAVDPHKQHILRKMASAYLCQLPSPNRASVPMRFDILSVYFLPSGVEFEHLRNAFPRTEPEISRLRAS